VNQNGTEEAVVDWIYIVATATTSPPWNSTPSHRTIAAEQKSVDLSHHHGTIQCHSEPPPYNHRPKIPCRHRGTALPPTRAIAVAPTSLDLTAGRNLALVGSSHHVVCRRNPIDNRALETAMRWRVGKWWW
jgi:hypothetical protein